MIGFIIYVLAVYGVSALMTSYDGLGGVFLRIRNKYPHSVFTCIVCLSVWVAVLLFIPIMLGLGNFLTPLAVIGAIILIKEFTE